MSEFVSVERINSLKQGIEAKTGETYSDLTGGVQALMDGYGQGSSGGSSGAEMETGSFVMATAGRCHIETSLSNVSAALIWAEVPSGEYFYTLNTHTLYAVVIGLMPKVGSTRRIMHTTINPAQQFAAYQGGINGNIIDFDRASNAHGTFQPSQIIDESGATETITYRWVAFGGVTIEA